MRKTKAKISLRMRPIWWGPSLSAYRIIGHCRLYRRTEKTLIRLYGCACLSGASPLFTNGIRAFSCDMFSYQNYKTFETVLKDCWFHYTGTLYGKTLRGARVCHVELQSLTQKTSVKCSGALCGAAFSDRIQSTLVVSKSKGLSGILRDIRTLTYQICRWTPRRRKIDDTLALPNHPRKLEIIFQSWYSRNYW